MPSSDPVVPVVQLLEAARQRVAETSLRTAAAEIGMEHTGLRWMLERGRRPRASTIRKLTEWYLKRAAAGELEISVGLVHAALAILGLHLPGRAREELEDEVVRLVRRAGDEAAVEQPAWIVALGK
jgi:hypothetical protein